MQNIILQNLKIFPNYFQKRWLYHRAYWCIQAFKFLRTCALIFLPYPTAPRFLFLWGRKSSQFSSTSSEAIHRCALLLAYGLFPIQDMFYDRSGVLWKVGDFDVGHTSFIVHPEEFIEEFERMLKMLQLEKK